MSNEGGVSAIALPECQITPLHPIGEIMSQQAYIQSLEEELAQAKRDAEPVIVEETERTSERVVYTNHTSGVVRTDLLGGTLPKPVEPVVVQAIASPWTEMPKEIGKVLEGNDTQRTAKLKSGAVRTDLR